MIENKNRLWAIIAAAGIGRRMQSSIPKQYKNLAGRFIIDITIERILSYSRIHKVFVVLAEDDKLSVKEEDQLVFIKYPNIYFIYKNK